MKKVLSLAVVLALCLSMSVIAGEQEGYGAPPKPLDKEVFGWMLGEWEGTTEGPMGKTEDWMHCEMALGGQFLHITYKSKTPMGDFVGMGVMTIIGDEVKGYWVDNGRTMSQGTGHRDGDKLVMTWSSQMGDHERITESTGDGKIAVTAMMTMNGQDMTFKSKMTRTKKTADAHHGHSH